MTENNRFRIQTLDGTLSHGTFSIAPEQPAAIKPDCLLMVEETTGNRLTVHATRLFPAATHAAGGPLAEPRSVCVECGQVSGVVEEEVRCPHSADGAPCVLIEPRQG